MDATEEIIARAPQYANELHTLTVLLKSCTRAPYTVAKNLLEEFGTLEKVICANFDLLMAQKGLGKKGALTLKACFAVANHLNKVYPYHIAFSSETAAKHFEPYFRGKTSEEMYIMLIDGGDRVLSIDLIAKGDVDKLNIEPAVIIDTVRKYNAKRAVLAHNHSTGLAPSLNDIALTSKLVWLLALLGIKLCEHIIFFEGKTHSMLKSGEITPLDENFLLKDFFI